MLLDKGLTAQKLKKSSTTNAIHFGQNLNFFSGVRNFKRLQDNKDYTFVGIGIPFKGNTKAKQVSFNSYAMSPNVKRGSIDALVRLPGTKLELETISKSNLFTSSTLYMDNDATEEAIKSSIQIKEAAVISFATHGMVSGELINTANLDLH